jgi:hypothetical protein
LGIVGVVVLNAMDDVARDRLPGIFLATAVVVVQVVWAATLLYFGFRFL